MRSLEAHEVVRPVTMCGKRTFWALARWSRVYESGGWPLEVTVLGPDSPAVLGDSAVSQGTRRPWGVFARPWFCLQSLAEAVAVGEEVQTGSFWGDLILSQAWDSPTA